MRSNVAPLPGRRDQRVRIGREAELYETEGTNERVKELSARASQEKEEDEEDEKLDLVLGELVKIMNMLDKGYGASKG